MEGKEQKNTILIKNIYKLPLLLQLNNLNINKLKINTQMNFFF